MRTDSLFYKLFQAAPEIFFELIGEPAEAAAGYGFQSVELKEASFRIDGVLLADEARPVYFSEVQFQRDEALYRRFFAEIFLYLRQNAAVSDWRGVLIYPQQSLEPLDLAAYRELLAGERVTRIYLDRLGDSAELPLASSLVRLVVEPEATAAALARELIERSGQESVGRLSGSDLIKLVETIIVYKFSTLSREEIEMMLGLADLKQTRVYQEGREEGAFTTLKEVVPNLLMLRFGEVSPQILQQLAAIQDKGLLQQCFQDAALASSVDEFAERFAVRLAGQLPPAESGGD